MVAALTMKEAVFCSNMMLELGFDKSFGSVPFYTDNTSALHVTGNLQSSRKAHRAEVFFHARTGGEGRGQHPLRRQQGSVL